MVDITPFNFQVTTDLHNRDDPHQDFNLVCKTINDILGGPGDFHITTGDFTSTVTDKNPYEFRDRIDENFGNTFRWIPVLGNHDMSDAEEPYDGYYWLKKEFYNDLKGV